MSTRPRKSKGWTQEELARKAGLAQSTVGSIENGARGYGESIVDIARVLEVTPSYLRCEAERLEEAAQKRESDIASMTEKERAQNANRESDLFIELLTLFQAADSDGRELILKTARKTCRETDIRWNLASGV